MENVIQVTGLTSDVAPVTAAEVVAGEEMTLKVLEPKRMTVPGPIAPDEELSLEEGITLKVLGAKKAIPVDLFNEPVTDAENRASSATKKRSLQEIRQLVLLDLPETD
ncbi:hypothetical protein ACI2J5_23450 [Agrobacterium pusense]|uniref:hypothetical protein n=1 Tax=Agrobacterium pusense TaxID=648995 RepID=UPI0038506690